MVNVILDTQTWIYIANGYNQKTKKFEDEIHFKLLDNLIKLINEQKISLYTNKIIKDEWIRNKKASEESNNMLLSKVKNYEDTANNIKKGLSEKGIDKLNEVLTEYAQNTAFQIEKNKKHVKLVEDLLFNKCIYIPISRSAKMKAVNLALKKKAPFHNKNNSVADAIILLSTVEYLKNIEFDWISNSIFVSNNSDDYCERKGSDIIHPDLKPFFQKASMRFESNLAKALNLSQDIAKEITSYFTYIDQDWQSCSASCKGTELGLGVFLLNEEVVPFDEAREIIYYDHNQLQINFGPEWNLSKEIIDELNAVNSNKLRAGSCDFCGAFHIECSCEELFYTYSPDDFEHTCQCGRTYIAEDGILTVGET